MTTSLQKQLTIPCEYHGQRIDAVLAQLVPEYSRSQMSLWIKSHGVTLNGKPCKPRDKVAGNDRITIDVDWEQTSTHFAPCEAENIPLDIIHEDDQILVLNKPSNLVVHPGAGNPKHTLVNALLHHTSSLHQLPRAGIIHRLDKDTTGLLLVAKTLSAHTSLIRQMQAREIQRHYCTLVQGYVISGGTIETFFGRHPRNRLKMAVTKQGREAVTHYSIQKHYPDFTLLDVALETGRTHQIRVHLAHINHSVVGDPLYGGRMRFPKGASDSLRVVLQDFRRQALHAGFISFQHPETQAQLTLEAPIPDDFKLLLKSLDDHYEC